MEKDSAGELDRVTELRKTFARVITGRPEPVDEEIEIWVYDPPWEPKV
jgi:hypothetical protein